MSTSSDPTADKDRSNDNGAADPMSTICLFQPSIEASKKENQGPLPKEGDESSNEAERKEQTPESLA
ncbi:hypothetical protein VNI00_015787 [Paramarasmius palmivorus]|uniref:Prolactin receptor n=1 Tax=Paramarasmius palmivorus TaxID=297713 RepID=A0AAW0BIG6_9AGAR